MNEDDLKYRLDQWGEGNPLAAEELREFLWLTSYNPVQKRMAFLTRYPIYQRNIKEPLDGDTSDSADSRGDEQDKSEAGLRKKPDESGDEWHTQFHDAVADGFSGALEDLELSLPGGGEVYTQCLCMCPLDKNGNLLRVCLLTERERYPPEKPFEWRDATQFLAFFKMVWERRSMDCFHTETGYSKKNGMLTKDHLPDPRSLFNAIVGAD